MQVSREQVSEALERAEGPLLWLAAGAVGVYVADLAGVWAAAGLEVAVGWVALGIDAIFVVDLLAKQWSRGVPYLRTPWFLVDLLCALPLLSTLSAAPSALQGLRFVRLFRMLRALRMLRVLRSLRVLRVLQHVGTTAEQHRYHQVLAASVVVYAVAFVGLVSWVQAVAPTPAEAQLRELLLVVGSLMGMGLILLVTRFQVPAIWSRQMRALLNVALPAQVAEHFMKNPEAYDENVRMAATVIFCDIKGFTRTVEDIGIEDLKVHLEAALDAVVDAHIAQDLIIDKFIGDAVMSFRGGNLVTGDAADHAYRVVRGAVDGALALQALGDPFFQEIKVGGASAPDALIGTFGTSKRLSYTVLGDRVNLAARLEASCNALGVKTLFCDRTRQLVGDRDDLVWRKVGDVRVQGKDVSTVAWEVFDHRVDTSWLAVFHEGLDAWFAADFHTAAQAFEATLAARGDDGPSALYLASCRELMASGAPEGWTPVLATTK